MAVRLNTIFMNQTKIRVNCSATKFPSSRLKCFIYLFIDGSVEMSGFRGGKMRVIFLLPRSLFNSRLDKIPK